jgi:alkanesulfonate monooxygenase SsuD/methylene tetrahydromethanopterin reductase-like flavin-dependent oxidoreductase (luciferase family)
VAKPAFGIFDHIEGIPGTSTRRLLQDRIELVKIADEAGFLGYHLAEHHGSDLCMAPTQEVFLAAAAQATENIRLGPLVKLLPLHHPVRIVEDLCILDQLSGGRVEFGVGRGVAPIEHAWFGSSYRDRNERFEDTLRIIWEALATGEISGANSKYYDFPAMPLSTEPLQQPVPFWYPGSPVVAGRYGMQLMWPGPIDAASHEAYVEAWHRHAGDPIRFDAPGSEPRVGCTITVALAATEEEAKEIAGRAMDGLGRRTMYGHRLDHLVLSPEECEAALGPLRFILSQRDAVVAAGAGTPDQVAERLAAFLELGLSDYLVLQLPTGDMTFEEAKRTLELFVAEVKPRLEAHVSERGKTGRPA